jgi:hypothetical protein
MRRNVPPAAYRGESFVDAARNRSRLSRGQDFSVRDLPPRRPSTSYECRAVFYQVRLEVRAAVMSVFLSRRGRFLTMEVFPPNFFAERLSVSWVIWFLTLAHFFSSFSVSFSCATFLISRLSRRQNNFSGETRIRLISQISFCRDIRLFYITQFCFHR